MTQIAPIFCSGNCDHLEWMELVITIKYLNAGKQNNCAMTVPNDFSTHCTTQRVAQFSDWNISDFCLFFFCFGNLIIEIIWLFCGYKNNFCFRWLSTFIPSRRFFTYKMTIIEGNVIALKKEPFSQHSFFSFFENFVHIAVYLTAVKSNFYLHASSPYTFHKSEKQDWSPADNKLNNMHLRNRRKR